MHIYPSAGPQLICMHNVWFHYFVQLYDGIYVLVSGYAKNIHTKLVCMQNVWFHFSVQLYDVTCVLVSG